MYMHISSIDLYIKLSIWLPYNTVNTTNILSLIQLYVYVGTTGV